VSTLSTSSQEKKRTKGVADDKMEIDLTQEVGSQTQSDKQIASNAVTMPSSVCKSKSEERCSCGKAYSPDTPICGICGLPQRESSKKSCPLCTFHNAVHAKECEMCRFRFSSSSQQKVPPRKRENTKDFNLQASGQRVKLTPTKRPRNPSSGSNLGKKQREITHYFGKSPKKPEGVEAKLERSSPVMTYPRSCWTCSECTFINDPVSKMCRMCHTPVKIPEPAPMKKEPIPESSGHNNAKVAKKGAEAWECDDKNGRNMPDFEARQIKLSRPGGPNRNVIFSDTNFNLPLDEYDPECPGGRQWAKGESVPYLYLAHVFESLSGTTKRLQKLRILTNLFRTAFRLTPEQLEDIIYLCTNTLGPAFAGINLSIGGSTISWAVSETSGVTKARMRELYKAHGDLGDIAFHCKSKQRTIFAVKSLSIPEVRNELLAIAKEQGSGSQTRRKRRILKLLTRCRSIETRWIVRTLCLHLRTGATRTSCLAALAQAKVLHERQYASTKDGPKLPKGRVLMTEGLKGDVKAGQKAVADAYNRRPDIGEIVQVLVSEGSSVKDVERILITPGLPVCCMLANTTRSIEEIIKLQSPDVKDSKMECQKSSKTSLDEGQSSKGGEEALSEAVSQYKYDGQRAQIHKISDGGFKIFSRHNDDITQRFPDVLTAVKRCLSEAKKELILDAEICGVDRANDNKLLSFQQFSTRAKKATTDHQVSVCVFLFDLLYYDGQSLLHLPFRNRERKLREIFRESPGALEFAAGKVCKVGDEISCFLKKALEAGTEGLVVKLLNSPYTPGKRGNLWLKLKPDYSDSMGDSIDVVPIGAWYGNGRKAGWFSPFLLAVYDPEMEQYQTLCRCMSGFTDEFYKEKTKFFKKNQISPQPMIVRGENPSVWFKPCEVWEIRGAELTVSPVHKAGEGLLSHEGKGLSIRFPRFIRVRKDRDVTDTTTPDQLVDIFNSQARRLS